jgi:sensor histidine kinase YesM
MNRIQKKIWMLAMVVLVFMSAIWIALTYYNHKTQSQYNNILQRYLSFNEVSIASQQLVTDLNNYLLLPSPANLENISTSKEKISKAKYEVYKLKNAENDFALTNYINLIDSLMETADRAMLFQSEKETEDSANEFSEATRISMYISETSLTLLDKELKTYELMYRGIIAQSKALNELGVWLLLLITSLSLLLTYWISRSITRPVENLTKAANELSKGRFDLQIKVDSNDEIAFLAKTFDHMRVNINNLISEIQEKAQLEHELQQNKLLLQESQLISLQSQINPHFLFNTLNTLSKKAYLEGAEETSNMIVNVAGLLRYSLKRLDRSVSLHEEIAVLKQYIDIQKARFTERLKLHMEVDDSCLGVQIPGLTLQPIIENAVIHAVEPEEDGGVIWFRILDKKDRVRIEIEDDGPGMPQEKIKQILEGQQITQSGGHSTGIGLANVVKRLRLFYENEDVFEIHSEMGLGTTVVLNIPKTGRAIEDDKAPDRG